MIKDIILGAMTWAITIGCLIGSMALMFYLIGPPTGDRARSLAFVAGGASLLAVILFFAALILFVFVYYNII